MEVYQMGLWFHIRLKYHWIMARFEYAYDPFHWRYHELEWAKLEAKRLTDKIKWE